jgi:hypothetical protein
MLDELDQQQAAFNEAVASINDMFDAQRSLLENALGRHGTDADLDEAFEDIYNRLTNRVEGKAIMTDNSVPRDPENPAIRNEAEKLGVSPERVVYELERRDVRDGFADEISAPTPDEKSEVGR